MENGAGGPLIAAKGSELYSLLASLRDVVWIAPPGSDQTVFVSDACREVYGREAREFENNPRLWLQVVHPDDRAIAQESALRLGELGEANVEYRITRPDGETRWVSDRKVQTRDGSSGTPFISGIVRDITDRKLSERLAQVQHDILKAVAMRESLTQILESICREIEQFVPDSVATILLLDSEGRLRVAAAPTCARELTEAIDGLTPGRNVGSCGTAAYTAEPCIVTDTLTDERWESFRDAARRFGILSCWSLPILSRGRRVLGTFAISSFAQRSPTEFHRELLETATQLASVSIQNERDREALLEAKETAEAATRTKSELLANVSHELRTPMTAILGFSEMLLQDETIGDRQRQDLQLIKNSGTHLLEIINNLLDVSKIEAGRMELEKLSCSPREILTDTVTLFRHAIRDKGLELVVDGTESLPPSVLTDPMRIRQILVNLLSNAVKFTEAGRIEIRCRSEPLEDDRIRLEVAVSDSGIGVAPEQVEQIFTPFGQAHSSTTRRFGGTGLGLSLSRNLARRLGGEISLASEPGRGSTFTLNLVVELSAGDREGETAGGSRENATVESAHRSSGSLACRVLLVEDTATVQRLVQSILEKAGAEVLVAADGEAACRAVREAQEEAPFDIVLMDMHMPVMDGYEAVRTLRRQGYRQPVVALTARAQPEDREKCLKAGCTAFMSKPLQADELVTLVAKLTGRVCA